MSEKRDAYIEKMKMKLDNWNAEIDKFQARAGKAQADAKVEHRKQLDGLMAKRQELEEKIADLHRAGDGAWEEVKKGVDSAWQVLGESIEAARSKFN